MSSTDQSIKIPRIDGNSLLRRIEAIAATGATRLAYSEEDIRGRAVVEEMMRDLRLEVRTDAAGNIIARRPGKLHRPPIVFGSHVDTVRDGGRYDGILGVMAGIECIAALEQADCVTEHPLEVIVFSNEEGQRFGALCGSRALVGLLNDNELGRRDGAECTLAEAIDGVGGNVTQLPSAIRNPGDIAAFVELHIEQGGLLESSGTNVGIVEGISGICYTEVRVSGHANHSGTTVMEHRRDALVAASDLILAVQQTALEGMCRVATVGRMMVLPNANNIIPGEVILTIEVRDLERARMVDSVTHIRRRGESISQQTGVQFEFVDRTLIEPVPCSPIVREAIRQACTDLSLSYCPMPSGAGHDAQMMARIGPMGMIFVPSVDGVSHSPREFTSQEDCVHGAEVLLHTIQHLDRILSESVSA